MGKNNRADFSAPCRTNKYPREIPELPWYRLAVPQMVMAGFLPFSAIYIELYYIFASVWGHKVRGLPCFLSRLGVPGQRLRLAKRRVLQGPHLWTALVDVGPVRLTPAAAAL